MKEWAEAHLSPHQEFQKHEPIEWFTRNYPKLKSSTVDMHVEAMSTNNGSRRRHHPSIYQGSNHDLFFKIGQNRFRLWDQQSDPSPVYDLEEVASPDNEASDDNDNVDDLSIEEAREFAYERDLQNFLAKNIDVLESGLSIYDNDGIEAVEFPAGNGRRIDILAVDAEDRFVVIELKVSKGYDRAIGQIARYMGWVSINMETNKPVRGIIVANHITDDLKMAASMIPNVTLSEYRMHFQISRL